MGHDREAPQPAAEPGGPKAPVLAEGEDLITGRDVSRITGLPARRVPEAARAGHLTAIEPPAGVRGLTRYTRSSAEALARTMVRPATATAASNPSEGDRPHG